MQAKPVQTCFFCRRGTLQVENPDHKGYEGAAACGILHEGDQDQYRSISSPNTNTSTGQPPRAEQPNAHEIYGVENPAGDTETTYLPHRPR
jgi:hypothetical protein